MAIRSESRKRTKLVQVRATPQEKMALRARADGFGVSIGELCRRAIFDSVPKSRVDQNAIMELAEMRADLGRLGGLLKGWLAGSFNQPPPGIRTRDELVVLLRKIETAQQCVVDAVHRINGAK